MLARVRSNLAFRDLLLGAMAGEPRSAALLESAFAERYGFRYAALFPYARSALRTLLEALGWRCQEVLCPAYICAEVPYSVTLSGNRVAFVDSTADHFLPGAREWRAAATGQSVMAIFTPLFGYPVDRQGESAVRDAAPNAFILYDEAQSYGVSDRGGLQARDADGVLFSLGLGKMVTALSGGMLLLRDPVLHRRVCELRNSRGVPSSLGHKMRLAATGAMTWLGFREPALSIIDFLGRYLHLVPTQPEEWLPADPPYAPLDSKVLPSDFQARVGCSQFARLDAFLQARRDVGRYYDERLLEQGFRTFETTAVPTWPRYPLAVADRATVITGFRKEGIQTSMFLPYSSADLPAYRRIARACPNATLWGQSMINLPNWYGIKPTAVKRVVDALVRLRERCPESVAWPEFANR